MVRKDRIIVKHLSEDKTVQSIPGELIISLVSGHISVKGDVFTYSITKDIESSFIFSELFSFLSISGFIFNDISFNTPIAPLSFFSISSIFFSKETIIEVKSLIS